MKRKIERELLEWKEGDHRMPLLLRGARQVGKSYIVEKFGQEQFRSCITVNFELDPSLCDLFSDLNPVRIVRDLETHLDVEIVPGETLLFFDEIQECPRAIMALRYFKEKMPALHVIGAGSLLEFALHDENFRFPVGRVQFMYLKPLSFEEYLEASGKQKSYELLTSISLGDSISPVIHEKLLQEVKTYVALGGMPAVIRHYIEHGSLKACQEIQSDLLKTFRNDFGKYAKKIEHKYLQQVFQKAPGLIAQWFKYSKVDPDVQSRTIKSALEKLVNAGLIHQVYATSAHGIPLFASMNSKKFKLLFLDIGLVKRACRLDLDLLLQEDLMLINQGALAEQFVGQQLIASDGAKEEYPLFFWIREKKGSSAEVDYIISVDSAIFPIEVKSGSSGKLRSLKLFMDEKESKLGIQISQKPFAREGNILSIPFYLVGQLRRLIG